MKESLKEIIAQLEALIQVWDEKQQSLSSVQMPGYTHMQRAMPTTVGRVCRIIFQELISSVVEYISICFTGLDKDSAVYVKHYRSKSVGFRCWFRNRQSSIRSGNNYPRVGI